MNHSALQRIERKPAQCAAPGINALCGSLQPLRLAGDGQFWNGHAVHVRLAVVLTCGDACAATTSALVLLADPPCLDLKQSAKRSMPQSPT
jgi:hypothetical protein